MPRANNMTILTRNQTLMLYTIGIVLGFILGLVVMALTCL